MTDHERLGELSEKLWEYCEHEGDEHGEYVRGLCQISNYSYCMDKDFTEALIKQMEWEAENYRKFCRIVKDTVTYTREYVELEWL